MVPQSMAPGPFTSESLTEFVKSVLGLQPGATSEGCLGQELSKLQNHCPKA